MSIKNRIKKVECKLNINSDFCTCPKETIFKIAPSDKSEETGKTNYCETCHKQMPNPLKITFSFNNNIQIIEPTAEFSRKEFEDWQNQHVVSRHISFEEYQANQLTDLTLDAGSAS